MVCAGENERLLGEKSPAKRVKLRAGNTLYLKFGDLEIASLRIESVEPGGRVRVDVGTLQRIDIRTDKPKARAR